MATHKHIDALCIAITALTLLLTILFMNGKALGIQVVANEENSDAMFTENDLNAPQTTSGATKITLSDEGSTVNGNGAYVYNGDIHIIYAGKYVLSGEVSDSSVIVEADGDDKIWLMLDNASIHCEDNAAIRVEQAGKVFLTLQDGTDNTISTGSAYSDEAVSAGVDGAVYSRDDLTINGGGSLRVTSEYRHGIVCNDDFVVTGGTINVTAAQDCIHANDSARFKNADLTLSAGDDGVTVSNDDETSYIYVESGNITVLSCYEGLEAVCIDIAGGTLNIASDDDGLNANGYSGSSVINISGGDITVTVENGRDADGIDSNNDIYISGGKPFISVSDNGGSCAIDYGSESGGKCQISGGTVLACGGSGMAEGFDSASAQGFLMQTVSAAADTTVTLKDADGNELISEKVPCSFSSVLVSTPEMQVGDTCTLIVGESETELTVDNTSSGGFGGGMPVGKVFGGGEMPARGGFGRNGGGNGFDGAVGEAQGMESAQTDGKTTAAVRLLSAEGTVNQGGNAQGNNAPPDMQSGGTPPELPENGGAGGMQPPDMQNGAQGDMTPPDMQNGADGDTSSDLPNGAQGDMTPPDMQNGADGDSSSDLQNGAQGDMTPPDMQNGADGDTTRDMPQRGMQAPNGNAGEQESASQTADTAAPVSLEQLIFVGISSLVLLCGCIIAFFYKRRG